MRIRDWSSDVCSSDLVRGVGGRKMAMDLGQVSQANADRVLRDTGIDISGARREIDNSAINHALKQHGSDTTEAKRGQAAITPEDFGKIPEIVADRTSGV